jgi:oxygen-dependent protoporphyrinogen oxidase
MTATLPCECHDPASGPHLAARFDSAVSRRVVIVGGGIAGLAAAHRLRELGGPDADVVVLERSDRLGGKIRTEPFAGQPVEAGAETFLMLDQGGESAALALARRVGLGDELVHPAPVPAALALDGSLRPIPAGTLMGVPADPAAVRDVAVVKDNDRDDGRPLLGPREDIAVGALIRPRLGDAIVDRLVDPLLGGVYAGRADELSLAATMPGLHRVAAEAHTLIAAVQRAMTAAPRPPGTPVFASVHGGLSRFVAAVAGAASADVRLGQTVRAVSRTGRSWALTVGPTIHAESIEADALVLAIPAAPAARLLGGIDKGAAAEVGQLDYASVALVTLALPPGTVLPELSGFLVPAGRGYAVKAATFFSTKWPGPREAVVVRASVGRRGEEATLQQTDDALIAVVRQELPRLLGLPIGEPRAARVNRWGGGLPQYGVGHVARVAAARRALPSTVALAGAAHDGVGIAACVRSGQAAAEAVWTALGG